MEQLHPAKVKYPDMRSVESKSGLRRCNVTKKGMGRKVEYDDVEYNHHDILSKTGERQRERTFMPLIFFVDV